MNSTKQERAAELLQRARDLADTEDWEGIVQLLEPECVSRPSYDLTWQLGWSYFKLGELGSAKQWMGQAHALAEGDKAKAIAAWSLATIAKDSGDEEDAEQLYQESLRLRDTYLARLGLATLYMGQHRMSDAEAVHKEGIRLKPRSRKRLEAYSDFLLDANRKEEAEALVEQAKDLDPDT